MALTVETGSGSSTADAYISQADADAYFAERGSPSAWSALSSDGKDAAIRYATTTLDGLYAWTGTIVLTTQALGWPRSGATDREGRTLASNDVPARVEDAVCELALLHAGTALNASYARGGAIRRERVGPLDTEYSAGASIEPLLPILDRIIFGIGTRRSQYAMDVDRV